MNRRGFLAALAGLPFVGSLFRREEQCRHEWKCVVARCSRKVGGLQVTMDEMCQLCRKNASDLGTPPMLMVECCKCSAKGRAQITSENPQPCSTCGAIRTEMDKVAIEFSLHRYEYQCGQCGAHYSVFMGQTADGYGRCPTMDEIRDDMNRAKARGWWTWHSQH